MAGVDVLVVAGAWALGSVAVSLVVGAVVSRADRSCDQLAGSTGRRSGGSARPGDVTVLALAPRARRSRGGLPLPAPRTSAEQVGATLS